MADSDIGGIFLAMATLAGSVILWVRAELAKLEQKNAVKAVVVKLNEANSQGDSIASIGKLILSDVIKTASTIPTLKPFVDKLELIHADAVNVWNREDGSDEQMAALVKAANDIYGIVQNALPAKVTA